MLKVARVFPKKEKGVG